jgi:hypothetical protein
VTAAGQASLAVPFKAPEVQAACKRLTAAAQAEIDSSQARLSEIRSKVGAKTTEAAARSKEIAEVCCQWECTGVCIVCYPPRRTQAAQIL